MKDSTNSWLFLASVFVATFFYSKVKEYQKMKLEKELLEIQIQNEKIENKILKLKKENYL